MTSQPISWRMVLGDKFQAGLRIEVPLLVWQTVEHIETTSLDVEGIFRVPGRAVQVKALREAYRQGPAKISAIDFSKESPYTVCSLLMDFLRDGEPVLMFDLVDDWISASQLPERQGRIDAFRHLKNCLPVKHTVSLFILLRLLHGINEHSASNKMPLSNLGPMFGPAICRRKESDIATELRDVPRVSKVLMELVELHQWVFDSSIDSSGDATSKEHDDKAASTMVGAATKKPSIKPALAGGRNLQKLNKMGGFYAKTDMKGNDDLATFKKDFRRVKYSDDSEDGDITLRTSTSVPPIYRDQLEGRDEDQAPKEDDKETPRTREKRLKRESRSISAPDLKAQMKKDKVGRRTPTKRNVKKADGKSGKSREKSHHRRDEKTRRHRKESSLDNDKERKIRHPKMDAAKSGRSMARVRSSRHTRQRPSARRRKYSDKGVDMSVVGRKSKMSHGARTGEDKPSTTRETSIKGGANDDKSGSVNDVKKVRDSSPSTSNGKSRRGGSDRSKKAKRDKGSKVEHQAHEQHPNKDKPADDGSSSDCAKKDTTSAPDDLNSAKPNKSVDDQAPAVVASLGVEAKSGATKDAVSPRMEKSVPSSSPMESGMFVSLNIDSSEGGE